MQPATIHVISHVLFPLEDRTSRRASAPMHTHIRATDKASPPANSLLLPGLVVSSSSSSSSSSVVCFFVSFDPRRYSHQEEQLRIGTRPAAVSCSVSTRVGLGRQSVLGGNEPHPSPRLGVQNAFPSQLPSPSR